MWGRHSLKVSGEKKKENVPYFFSSILNDANSCQIHLDCEEMIELFMSLVDMNT